MNDQVTEFFLFFLRNSLSRPHTQKFLPKLQQQIKKCKEAPFFFSSLFLSQALKYITSDRMRWVIFEYAQLSYISCGGFKSHSEINPRQKLANIWTTYQFQTGTEVFDLSSPLCCRRMFD